LEIKEENSLLEIAKAQKSLIFTVSKAQENQDFQQIFATKNFTNFITDKIFVP